MAASTTRGEMTAKRRPRSSQGEEARSVGGGVYASYEIRVFGRKEVATG